jgi:hypothetical protein
MKRLAAALLMAGVSVAPAAAQDTHLLVITGVAGTPEHATRFTAWATAVVDAAQTLGVLSDNIEQLSDTAANREGVNKAFAALASRAKPDDEVFIILFGHGSFTGGKGAFNLVGPDLSAADFDLLLDQLSSQRVAFVNTASSSGAFLEPLAGPGRTIVTATRTGGERNETRFPEFFVEALSSESADQDRNGRLSILEVFEFATSGVEGAYEQTGHIPTEHAALEDGSDGKLAASLYLAPPRSRSAEMAHAAPELLALVEKRDALEQEVNNHRLLKGVLDDAGYEQELERLLTELALTTRAIRQLEAK